MHKRPILYITIITLAALLAGICPGLVVSVSSQEIPSYAIAIEFDKDGYYAGETVYFDVKLIKDQEPVALDSLEVEAVLIEKEKALPLKEHKGSRGVFSCILEANEENPVIEVTVYRKKRQERAGALLARKEKLRKDIERLRDSRWFLFWKREKIGREIDQLGKAVEKLESSVKQLNAPLAKALKSITVLSSPAILLNTAAEEKIKEPEGVALSFDDADSSPDTAESFSPGPGDGSHIEESHREQKLEKPEETASGKPRTSGQPKAVKKSFQTGSVSTPPGRQEKAIPKEKISEEEDSETPIASTPPVTYIPPFYSRVKDTIPPVTSSDYKKNGIVTNEDVRITLQAADNAKGVEKTFYRINGGGWREYDRPITDFANGEHVVEYYSIDKDGNKEDPPRSLMVRIDRIAPDLAISYPPSTQENTAIISGTVSEDTSALTMDGHQILLKGGTFSITHVPLPARKNVFRFEAIDQAGNKTVRDVAIECLWDKTAPSVAIKGIEHGAFYPKAVTPVVGVDDTQSKAETSFTLNGEPFSSGTPISKDGKYTLIVAAVDAYENHASLSVSFGVDRTAPETEDDYKKADVWSNEDAKIVFLAADAGSGVEAVYYRIGGGAFMDYQSPLEIREEGVQKIQYYAQDKIGNKESVKTVTVKIDKTVPALDVKSVVTGEATGILTPVNLPAPAVKDNLDNAAQLNTEHSSREGYPLGTTRVLYKVVDHAGNMASAATDVKIQDSIAPQISFDSPQDNSYAAHAVNVRGEVKEIFLKHLLINGEQVNVVDGQFVKTVQVADDKFPVGITAVDTSGNEDTVSRTVLRDILPPRTYHDYARDGVWTQENARITLSASDAASGVKTTYYREDNGAFVEYKKPFDIKKEGKYNVEYYSTDEVGNEEEHRNISVWIDWTPPAVKITSPRNGVYVSGKTVEVRGTVSDAFLSYVLVNGQPAAVSDGGFVATVPLAQEKIALTAEAFDEAGHHSSDSVNITLDASLPVTTDDYAFDNVWVNQDAQIRLTAIDSDSGIQATYYRIYADGTIPPASILYNPGNAIAINQDGQWIVEYYSVDQVGERESPHLVLVLLDKTAPVTADNHGGHINPTNEDAVIVLTATDALSGVDTIYARLDQAGFASVVGPVTVSQDGAHVLEYYALDKAGNEEAHKTLDISIDKTSPRIMVDSPADGSIIAENTVTIKGPVSSDTVALTLNGQSVPLVNNTFLVNNFKLAPGENRIALEAQDGVGNQTTLEITVTKVNRPPELNPIADVTIDEGETVNFSPDGSDPDGDSVTFSYSGWMTGASYTTTHDDAGTHTVTVTISDGTLTDSEDVTVTVMNVNRPPVLDPVADVSVNEGEVISFHPTASDPDGDSLTFSYSGWMTSSSYVTTYDDAGKHALTVTVSDGNLTDSQNVAMIVNNANRPPVADAQKVSFNEDTPTAIVLTGSDPDQDSLNYVLVSAPSHGMVSGNAPHVTYTPHKNYNGPDAFIFKVNDGGVDSIAATVDLLAHPVNDAPVLGLIGNKSVDENGYLEFTVTATDVEGDILTIAATPLKSWMSFNGTTFSAGPGFGDSGNYAVTFTVTDGKLTDTEAIALSVGDVNRPPQLAPIGDYTVEEGNLLKFVLSASDPDGDTFHFAASHLPAGSKFNATTRTFVWQPGYDQAGVYAGVHFEVDDGEFSDFEEMTITVNNINRAPVLNPVADITVNEGATVALNPEAVDPDGDKVAFTYVGWMSSSSRITGHEDAGVYTVTVTASDGQLTDSQDVMVTVKNANRTPVLDPIANITVNEGEAVVLNPGGSDPDGDKVTFVFSGWMNVSSYATSYSDAGVHTVTVTASDGYLTDSQDVMVTVNNVNRPPVLDPIANVSVNEGEVINFKLGASDPDGDSLTFLYSGWMTSSSYATTYDDAGQYKVTVMVSDGIVTDAQDVNVTVANTNRPPVFNPVADITVHEGETVIINAAGSDPDGDSVTLAYAGWMSSSSRTTGYTDAGVHAVTVTVSDGTLSDSRDVTVTVVDVNRAPVLDFIFNLTVYEGATVTFKPAASDPDGDALTFTYSGWMSSSSYIVKRGDSGSHTVTVSVFDGKDTDSQDVTVTVDACGDGIKNGPEICDEGTNNGTPNHCNAQCTGTTAGVCGNNIKESDEACDDGNKISGDGCSSSCVMERCGDGIVQTGLGETCEGNSIKSCVIGGYAGVQSCTNCTDSSCVLGESCGDGTIQTAAGEACDDGNTTSDDGCSATCKSESCGDGVVQAGLGEQCDDGNKTAGDGCNAGCKNEYCGDGVVQAGLDELCDGSAQSCTGPDGYPGSRTCDIFCAGFDNCVTVFFCGDGACTNPPETTVSCPSDCPAVCGNGIAEPSEECDDHNTVSGDGCSATCKLEICGDGIVQASRGEQCDDGNTTNGDGCGGNCQVEQLADTTAPSVPTGLTATVVSSIQINLSWSASTDNVGVAGYKIYRDGVLQWTVDGGVSTYSDTNPQPSTTYTYSVSAYDASGNGSAQSTSASATTSASAGKVYYTDKNLIADCNSGNYSIANRSCTGADGNAYNTIQEAVNAANIAGDIIYVRSGMYVEAISMKASGSANNYIVLQGYNNEIVIIQPGTGNVGINLAGYDWLKIDGFVIDGGQTGIRYMPSGGVDVSEHIIIANNTIRNQVTTNEPQGGIAARPYYWEIYGNTFSGISGAAGREIIFYGSGKVGIDSRCELNIHDNVFDNHSAQDNIHLGGCINVNIENNIFNSGSGGTGHDDSIALECTNNVTINHNLFNGSNNFDIDAQTCSSGRHLDNTVVTNNVLISIAGTAVHIKDGSYDIQGNTFYDGLYAAIKTEERFTPGSSVGVIKNNIFYGNGGYNNIYNPGGQAIDYNVYHNNGSASQNGDTGANSISVNPQFQSTTDFDGPDNLFWTLDDGLIPSCDVVYGNTAIGAYLCKPGNNTDTTPPTAPSGLTATAVSSSQIDLSWTVSTDNVGVTGYRIFRNGVQIATATATTYSDTSLIASTAYTYTVSAYDAAGNVSAQSASASATTQSAADTTPPTVPTGLAATAVSASQVNLSWTASTDNVGVTGYKVYRDGILVAGSQVAITSYSDTGLTASTVYSYTVSAIDAAGNISSQSSPAQVTTKAPSTGTTITVDFNANRGLVAPYHRYVNHVEKVRGPLDHQRVKDLGPTVERAYWVLKDWAIELGVYDFSTQGGRPYGSDPLFDDVIANGGEMLVSIQGNPSIKLPAWLQSSNPDFPNSLDNYQTVLEDGLRHLKQKYPQFKYLESQNEPGGEIKVTADEFKLMHERVQLAADTVNQELPANVPQIIVGGPGMGYSAGGMQTRYDYLAPVLDYISAKGLPLGFLSWHTYNETPLGHINILNQYYDLMTKRGYDSPMLVTESGYTYTNPDNWPNTKCLVPSNPDPTNIELSQSAAYIMATYLQYLDSGKDVTPFVFALHDYANNARSVLVYKCIDNRDGKVNPLYNALLMWSKLTGTRVEAATSDTNSSLNGVRGVAVKDGMEVRILVFNRDLYSAKNVQVILNNLPSQFLGSPVVYKRYLVDRQHNNYAANSIADLMKWEAPLEQSSMLLSNGQQLDIRLEADAISLLVFSAAGTPSDDTTPPTAPANVQAAAISHLSVPSNTLSNPGFESGTSPWVFYTNGTGTFAADAGGDGSVYAGHVTVSQPGTNVQLYQSNIALEPNTLYQLSFKAYSNTGHDASVSLQKHGSPYTGYGLSQVFDLTTFWAPYSVQFTTSGFTGTVNDGRLMLWLASYAASGDQYFFDDVELTKVNVSSDTAWEVNLSWDAATDDVGVTGYNIYRNGVLVTSTRSPVTSHSDTGLMASTAYFYTVSAIDAAGNESGQSIPASATTSTLIVDIIPSDRRIDWNPGIPPGIPGNYTLCANVKNSPYNAVGDGLADDTVAFQNALSACSSGTYVYVPAGTYKLTAGLTIPSGVLLKGDGPALSKLKDYRPAGTGVYLVQINGYSSSQVSNITAGYAKDSTQITVDDATSLNVNDYIMISQLNETGLATDKGYGNTCTWCGPRDLNERAMAQIVKIVVKNGNDLTLSRPIYYASSGHSPQAMKLGSSIRINSGIQDLYLERINSIGSGYNIILMQFCVNCWVKNIETYKTGGAHIRMQYTYGNEIRDSYFHEAWGYGSGAGYGILLITANSDNLVENNIFNLTRHSVVMEGGGSGNVIAYNFSKDPYDSDSPTWLSGDMITHGAHPYMNLFEGNYAANFENDNTWGSSSHNTYFRNHANRSRSITTTLAQRAIDVQANNHYMNYVGNVLGPATGGGTEGPGTNCGTQPIDWRAQGCNTPSGTENPPTDSTVAPTILRHGNYSYASGNTQWDPGVSNYNLPASYYLLSKPSFFGDLPWPGIGPDLNPRVGVLPAKARFDALQNLFDAIPPSAPSGLIATVVSSSQINLSWNASTDNTAVAGYRIYRDGTQIATSANTSYSDAGLAASTAYSYTVSAYDAAGNSSSQSVSASATTQSAADTTPPTVPTGLTATAVSSGQIDLVWNASTDDSGVVAYNIYRNGGGTPIASSAAASYSDTGLSASTTYSYTVRALDLSGNESGASASANAATQSDTTAPTTPTGLTATAVSSSQINLSWSASTDNVGVTGYKIFRDGIQVGTSATASYSNAGLSQNTNYAFTVSAYDPAGNESMRSLSAGATTFAQAGNTITAASCSSADVQNAINSAVDGDTVFIPAGACTWSNGVDIGTGTSRTKMVKLVGAGTDASTGTRITCNWGCIGAWLRNGLSGLDISYIRFIQGSSGEPWAIDLAGHADIYSSLFRIHHNYFLYASGSVDNSIFVGGLNRYNSAYDINHPYIFGLIDHNTFKADATTQGIDIGPVYSAGISSQNAGDAAWKLWEMSDHQGTWQNVFVEDNIIDSRPGWRDGTAWMDGSGGSAYVFRRNTIYNNWISNHDPGSNGWRGHKWTEAYDNIFVLDYVGSGYNGGITWRAGTGVAFNNEFYDANRKGSYVGSGTDTFNLFLNLQYYRACENQGGGGNPLNCPNNILCGQDSTLGCDNKNDASGWICRDQTGARKGADEPTWVFGYRFATEPIVAWNNNYTSSIAFRVKDFPACDETLFVRERRDFISDDSCTGHMGEAICSTFWDDTNHKKKNYIPYTYPHPLIVTQNPPPALKGDLFDWSVRTDRDGKLAGIFTTTPFPIDETMVTYSITNDEGTKIYNLGTICFVDNGASGCSNGSAAYNPATRSCGSGSYTVYTTIANARSAVTAGNKTILVRAGTYVENNISLRAGIDDTHRYSIIGYNQERPIIDGSGGSANGVNGAQYGTWQRFEMKNAYDAGARTSSTYNNFIDLYIHDVGAAYGNAGIHSENTDYVWIYHSTIYRTVNHGIKIADNSDYSTVEWSEVSEVGWSSAGPSDYCATTGWHCIAVDLVSHETSSMKGINNIIRYNIIHDVYTYAINLEHQESPSVHHNEIYHALKVYDLNGSPGSWMNNALSGSYSVHVGESPRGDFYGNVVRDKRGVWESLNDSGHLQFWESTAQITAGTWNVYNNLFYDTEITNAVEHMIQTQGNFQPGSTVKLYNNTIYADTAGGDNTLVAKNTWAGVLELKNNILYQAGTGSIIQGSPTVDYNLYYYPNGSLGVTPGFNDINSSNPLFVQVPSGAYDSDDAKLLSSSSARGAGTDLSGTFTSIFQNTSILRSAWDIGACEY